ncbi:hypothetical protein SUGI_0098320 [Cryptomeria japonica]|nr:hypothetical protein SUGI_0098320 [Cryptomeria japonica]
MSTFVSMEASQGSTNCDSNNSDHINGVEDRSQMSQSSGKSSFKMNRKYRYRGVRIRPSGRFCAQIKDPMTKRRRCLGTYDTPELAASAYDFAARTMRGTKARTNFFNLFFDSCNLTPSAEPTLSGTTDFNPPVLSRPSNLNYPLSSSLFNKPFQKQDHQFFHFGDSSSKLSSPWDKFGPTNKDISASGHAVSTNDFTLSCPIPYTQSFQLPSSPSTLTLKKPLQPFLNKTTSAVPHTISTNDFTLPCPIPYTQSLQVPSSHVPFTLNKPLQPFLNKTTSAVPQTISTTPSLPNPVFPLHHSFLASAPQSQQCSTVMPSNPFSSNAADCSSSVSGMSENISNQFTLPPIPTTESSSNTWSSACNIYNTLDYGFGFPKEPNSPTIPCTTIHSTTGSFNLGLQKGFHVNQNEQQCTMEYDIEKELSSSQLAGLCEWSSESQLYDEMPPSADSLFEDIPDVTTLPVLDNHNIWD